MAPSTLFQNIRLFDGEVEVPHASVLIQDGIITQVSTEPLEAPDASTVIISKPNHTLIPGIIDGHVHCDKGQTTLSAAIKFGVTTVCDMHQDQEFLPLLRSQALGSDSADFKTSSLSATIANGWPEAVVTLHDKSEETKALVAKWPKLKTKEDVDAYMQDRVEDEVDYIKMMHEDGAALKVKPPIPSMELQKYIIEAAHKKDYVVVAHCLSLPATMQMLSIGVDGLAHTFCDQPPTKELIDAYKKNNAYCNPTLATLSSLTNVGLEHQKKYAHDPRVIRFIPEEIGVGMCRCVDMAVQTAKYEYAVESVRVLKAAGVDIIVGSDSAGPHLGSPYGLLTHREMAILVEDCGFTPAEALRAATSLVASRLRLPDRGRIVPGLRADLVLVEGNVLENIDHTLDLRGVWKQGVLLGDYEGDLMG